MKTLGWMVLILISFAIWAFVLVFASRGFFDLSEPLGYLFVFAYIGLSIGAMAQWSWHESIWRHSITVHLSVTDEQRKALVDHTIASGYANSYSGLQACVADLLEQGLDWWKGVLGAHHS